MNPLVDRQEINQFFYQKCQLQLLFFFVLW